MRAPLSDSSSSSASEAGVGAGVGAGAGAGAGDGPGAPGAPGAGVGAITTVSVFEVTVAFSGTISLMTTARPDAASFSTKAVVKASAKLDDLVGSLSVSVTAVASERDVVTNSYSILSFVPCNC